MRSNILWMIAGIALVLWGADRLTDDAVAIAERMHMSRVIIGLMIVATGISMPEFFVSPLPALKSTPDMVVGDVLGSSIFNSLFTVGCATLVTLITILKSTTKWGIPFAFIASWMLLMLCPGHHLSRIDAGMLFAVFLLYMYFTLKEAKREPDENEEVQKNHSLPKLISFLLLSLGCLVFGGSLFADSATVIAKSVGVSDAVTGLTIIANGTSTPELVTSVVLARKRQSGIAIGNVLGSSVFNTLMILDITGLISPMQPKGIANLDLSVLIISTVMLWLFSCAKYTIVRWEDALLTVAFLGYMSYLVAGARGIVGS